MERHARPDGVNSEAVPQAFRGHVRTLGDGRLAHDAPYKLPSAAAREGPNTRVPFLPLNHRVERAEQIDRHGDFADHDRAFAFLEGTDRNEPSLALDRGGRYGQALGNPTSGVCERKAQRQHIVAGERGSGWEGAGSLRGVRIFSLPGRRLEAPGAASVRVHSRPHASQRPTPGHDRFAYSVEPPESPGSRAFPELGWRARYQRS